jgi:cell division protein FtsZ
MIAWRRLSSLVSTRDDGELKITVIGIGDGGCNVVDHMIGGDAKGFEFICANTDTQALNHSRAPKTIQLETNGLAARGQPDFAGLGVTTAEDAIRRELKGTHLLFIATCLGDGTGSSVAPEIARIASGMGIVTMCVVSMPYAFEGDRPISMAISCLKTLKTTVASLTVVAHDGLLADQNAAASQAQAFAHSVAQIMNSIISLAEEISKARHEYLVAKRSVISWYLKWRFWG